MHESDLHLNLLGEGAGEKQAVTFRVPAPGILVGIELGRYALGGGLPRSPFRLRGGSQFLRGHAFRGPL
jgi:hypothetical protein